MQSSIRDHAATSPALSRQLILEELSRVLASREFSRSPQLSHFLRFVVEETLDGRGECLKEYVIGVRVYHRGDAFDPRTDPIVRVQANKLRAHLAAYYAGRSAATPVQISPVQIEIPKGAYVPAFREHRAPQPSRR